MKEPKSIFIEIFGDYPALRIIDFMIESRMFDYPITEIARNSNVHFVTFKKVWARFIKNGFVKATRKMNGKDLYRINTENEAVKKLIELDSFLSRESAREAHAKKRGTAKHRDTTLPTQQAQRKESAQANT
jgi:predicted transcriptional regulator